MDGKITKTIRAQYACRCGSVLCRGTMLALPEKKTKGSKSKKK
jgi:hypothetical protein